MGSWESAEKIGCRLAVRNHHRLVLFLGALVLCQVGLLAMGARGFGSTTVFLDASGRIADGNTATWKVSQSGSGLNYFQKSGERWSTATRPPPEIIRSGNAAFNPARNLSPQAGGIQPEYGGGGDKKSELPGGKPKKFRPPEGAKVPHSDAMKTAAANPVGGGPKPPATAPAGGAPKLALDPSTLKAGKEALKPPPKPDAAPPKSLSSGINSGDLDRSRLKKAVTLDKSAPMTKVFDPQGKLINEGPSLKGAAQPLPRSPIYDPMLSGVDKMMAGPNGDRLRKQAAAFDEANKPTSGSGWDEPAKSTGTSSAKPGATADGAPKPDAPVRSAATGPLDGAKDLPTRKQFDKVGEVKLQRVPDDKLPDRLKPASQPLGQGYVGTSEVRGSGPKDPVTGARAGNDWAQLRGATATDFTKTADLATNTRPPIGTTTTAPAVEGTVRGPGSVVSSATTPTLGGSVGGNPPPAAATSVGRPTLSSMGSSGSLGGSGTSLGGGATTTGGGAAPSKMTKAQAEEEFLRTRKEARGNNLERAAPAGMNCGMASVFNKTTGAACGRAQFVTMVGPQLMFLNMLMPPEAPPPEIPLPGQTQTQQSLKSIESATKAADHAETTNTLGAALGGAMLAFGVQTKMQLSAADRHMASGQGRLTQMTGAEGNMLTGNAMGEGVAGHFQENNQADARQVFAKHMGANFMQYQAVTAVDPELQALQRQERIAQIEAQAGKVNLRTDEAIAQGRGEIASQSPGLIMGTGIAALTTIVAMQAIHTARTTKEKLEAQKEALLSMSAPPSGAPPPSLQAAASEKENRTEGAREPGSGRESGSAAQGGGEEPAARENDKLGQGFETPRGQDGPQGRIPEGGGRGEGGEQAGGGRREGGEQAGGGRREGGEQAGSGHGAKGGEGAEGGRAPGEERNSAALAQNGGAAYDSGSTPASGGGGSGGGGAGAKAPAGPDLNQMMDMLAKKKEGEEDNRPARNILFAGKEDSSMGIGSEQFADPDRDLFMMISEAMIAKSRELSEDYR